MKKQLRVDVVSDIVCPWCIIGYKRLEKAINTVKNDIEVDVHWHPYFLYPDLPKGGFHYKKVLKKKYGMTDKEIMSNRKRITQTGKELGFTFDYYDEMKTYNSQLAHQLVFFAREFDKGNEMKLQLFKAFFTHRMPLDNIDRLVAEAQKLGLDVNEARMALTSQKYRSAVLGEAKKWANKGVQSVPTYIFNNEQGISGAHEPKVLAKIMREMAS